MQVHVHVEIQYTLYMHCTCTCTIYMYVHVHVQYMHMYNLYLSLSIVPFYHMSSFGESSAFKHSENTSHSFIEYNKKHISRIYPSGRRMDSSNYEPVDMWNCGCQIGKEMYIYIVCTCIFNFLWHEAFTCTHTFVHVHM